MLSIRRCGTLQQAAFNTGAAVGKHRWVGERYRTSFYVFKRLNLANGLEFVEDCGVRYMMCLVFSQADNDQRSAWGLADFRSAGQICSECPADRDSLPFTDLRENAA